MTVYASSDSSINWNSCHNSCICKAKWSNNLWMDNAAYISGRSCNTYVIKCIFIFICACISIVLLSLSYLNGIFIKINSIGIGVAAIIHCLTCIGKTDRSGVALAIIITVLCMIAVNLIGKHLQLLIEEIADNK